MHKKTENMEQLTSRAMWDMPRWRAVITYRSEAGDVAVDYEFEELDEISDIVDRGPNWNTIIKIEIRLARVIHPNLKVEEEAALAEEEIEELIAPLRSRGANE